MSALAIIDDKEIEITPFFKYIEVEDVPQSEIAGHKVMKQLEVVEIRFAGSRNYAPVRKANEMFRREGNKVITYAERWADQYRAFKDGNPQDAEGTPLEMLVPYGVTPEMISLCRIRRIYSIEALDSIQGDAAKSLGMSQNKLKEAARKFLADRGGGVEALGKIAALEAEIAKLKAAGASQMPVAEPAPEEAEKLAGLTGVYDQMTDAEIKDRIKDIAGSAPRGNPSRATLVSMLSELEEAA